LFAATHIYQTMVSTDDVSLQQYREKWREVPRGSDTDGRVWSTDLLKLSNEGLLAAWSDLAARRYSGEMGWVGPLYFDTFKGHKVIELGSGLGYDGLRFAERGAHWTFADIVPDNLSLVRRIAEIKGLQDRVRFHLIGDDLSFDGLPYDYDAVWASGSIHHVPFEIARREALDVLSHLVAGGRWIELVYPRERWLREGALPFDQWGKLTDGDRTPWAEWHDVEKVKRRLSPAPFRTLLDFGFCGDSFRWIDLKHAGSEPFRIADRMLPPKALASVDLLGESVTLLEGARRRPMWTAAWSFTCPAGIFAPAVRVDLAKPLAALGAASAVAVDLEIEVTRGAVGAGLVNATGAYLPGAEVVVESGPGNRHATLNATAYETPAAIVFRNCYAGLRGKFAVRSAALRIAG
jgi:hypothetical protein